MAGVNTFSDLVWLQVWVVLGGTFLLVYVFLFVVALFFHFSCFFAAMLNRCQPVWAMLWKRCSSRREASQQAMRSKCLRRWRRQADSRARPGPDRVYYCSEFKLSCCCRAWSCFGISFLIWSFKSRGCDVLQEVTTGTGNRDVHLWTLRCCCDHKLWP